MCRIAIVLAFFIPGVIANAAEPSPVSTDKSRDWSSTLSLPAPEAHQAAAADAEFVYAITNTLVAKYDRLTGERVAVSGHDDPLFFRLRLPSQGMVLELVDTEAVPFTGQGFAEDAHTGGLVGINRGKRQVVFAVQN